MCSPRIGGPAIGEPLFQIADHFRSRPGLANRIALSPRQSAAGDQ